LSQIATKIATDEVFKTQTNNNIITDEFTIEPLDTCKDIVIDGKTYKNVVLSYKKTKPLLFVGVPKVVGAEPKVGVI